MTDMIIFTGPIDPESPFAMSDGIELTDEYVPHPPGEMKVRVAEGYPDDTPFGYGLNRCISNS